MVDDGVISRCTFYIVAYLEPHSSLLHNGHTHTCTLTTYHHRRTTSSATCDDRGCRRRQPHASSRRHRCPTSPMPSQLYRLHCPTPSCRPRRRLRKAAVCVCRVAVAAASGNRRINADVAKCKVGGGRRSGAVNIGRSGSVCWVRMLFSVCCCVVTSWFELSREWLFACQRSIFTTQKTRRAHADASFGRISCAHTPANTHAQQKHHTHTHTDANNGSVQFSSKARLRYHTHPHKHPESIHSHSITTITYVLFT